MQGFKELEFIDVGGGFGLPYRPREEPLNLTELGSGASVPKELIKGFVDFNACPRCFELVEGSSRSVNTGARALLTALIAFYTIVYFHRVMTGVMKVEVDRVASVHNVSPDVLMALLSSAYFYAYTVAQLFVGALTDTFGIKRVGFLFGVVMCAGGLIMCLMTPASLIIGRFLVGFSAAAAFLAYQRASSLSYDAGHQGRLTSYALTLGNLGGLAATYPLRLTLNTVGLRTSLMVLTLLALITATCVLITSDDLGSGKGVEDLKKTVMYLGVLARDPHVWGVSVGAVGIYGVTLAYQTSWGQKHMMEAFGMSAEAASQYLMLLALAFTLTCPLSGFLSDRVLKRRRPVFLAGSLASATSWMLMLYSTLTHDVVVLATSLTILGIASGLQIIASPMIKESYPVKYSATAIALLNITLFSSAAVLQTAAPLLSLREAILTHLIISLAGASLALTATRETLRQASAT
ncbi:MAG: MFS transporter [Zestosphaera sp.]